MNTLAHFFLFFNNWTFIVCLLLLGLMFGNRALFYHTTCIIMVSMIINVALKCTFQIPLSPTLHKVGFAFPSGHMQLAAVLYGSLLFYIKNRTLQMLLITLLAGIGFSLVHFGYHTWFDVLGAVFFAGLILGFYQILLRQKTPYLAWVNVSLTTLLMIYIAYRNTIPIHAWIAYTALLSFIFTKKHRAC
jgi:membrane-associated phospholipid phosphatase